MTKPTGKLDPLLDSEDASRVPGLVSGEPVSDAKALEDGASREFAGRPGIPAEVARQVMTESGHRCAVCGTPSPLERAHIVPWRKVRRHDAKNLVCLCANCHQRADHENWGEKTLLFYKQNPWVTRSLKEEARPPVQVRLAIDMEFSDFDELNARLLQHALAGFLEISPRSIKIIKIEPGSVKVTLQIPPSAARKLELAHAANSSELRKSLYPFELVGIEVQPVEALGIPPAEPAQNQEVSPRKVRKQNLVRNYLRDAREKNLFEEPDEAQTSGSNRLSEPGKITRTMPRKSRSAKKKKASARFKFIFSNPDEEPSTYSVEVVKTIKIRQVRSARNAREELKKLLDILGLGRVRQVIVRPDLPEVRAMISKVEGFVEVVEEEAANPGPATDDWRRR